MLSLINVLAGYVAVISNEDIRPLVPQLVSVIAHPDESIKTLVRDTAQHVPPSVVSMPVCECGNPTHE